MRPLTLDAAQCRIPAFAGNTLEQLARWFHFNEIFVSDALALTGRLGGIVSKRRDSSHESGIGKAWLKIKNSDTPAARRLVDVTQ